MHIPILKRGIIAQALYFKIYETQFNILTKLTGLSIHLSSLCYVD